MGIVKQKQTKNFVDFRSKISWIFKNRILFEAYFLENSIINKPSLGSREVQNKFGPDLLAVLTFIGYKQTDKQSIYKDFGGF